DYYCQVYETSSNNWVF
nr:immunoglobulin light chain junction region [Macaca mulatta]MOX77551.1 immunoglobulin light chain junction region [Macaca mulatta]MOX77939.1 immunoglobulin light chain junction region [Macaca mulatta]MOX77996.1 immunoglobulin light chain junction region [Macaca mulatta]MOX78839.1 immunoglobulin light chain junction region [Macaca mulatta]